VGAREGEGKEDAREGEENEEGKGANERRMSVE